jgi:ABC-type lipoprotein release transport system permease subunit
MNLIIFALRNLGRSRRRTIIQVTGIGLVTAMMLIWGGINKGVEDLLEKTATDLDTGEVQLHAPGYVQSPDLYKTMPYVDLWQKQFTKIGLNAAPRLYGFGLVGAGNQSAGVQLRGVDLNFEPTVTELNQSVREGTWFDKDSANELVIGRTLARRLHLNPGDNVVVLAQAADGSSANAVFRIRGVLGPVNDDVDARAVYLTLPAFQNFFRLQAGVHEIALKRFDKSQDLRASSIKIKTVSERLHPQIEVRTWRELKPVVAKMLDILSVSAKFIFAFIYLSLGGIIVNIAFMTIYDRISEFGTMTALGMMPRQVLGLIMAEACWLGAFTALLAWSIGIPGALLIQHYGLDLRIFYDQISMAGITIKPILFTRIGPAEIFAPVLFMFLALNIFCFYPGLDAARMDPIKALNSR